MAPGLCVARSGLCSSLLAPGDGTVAASPATNTLSGWEEGDSDRSRGVCLLSQNFAFLGAPPRDLHSHLPWPEGRPRATVSPEAWEMQGRFVCFFVLCFRCCLAPLTKAGMEGGRTQRGMEVVAGRCVNCTCT